MTRSLVASEGWSSVRDRTNRKHCPSHRIWSYKRDGRWRGGRSTGVLLYRLCQQTIFGCITENYFVVQKNVVG